MFAVININRCNKKTLLLADILFDAKFKLVWMGGSGWMTDWVGGW